MQENEITICGHGSGFPTTKNMQQYLTNRYNLIASNGVRKGLVAVRRRKGLDAGRQKAFREAFDKCLGRNIYSQAKREYALQPYADGRYYSDCSSIGDACLSAAGCETPWLNTAGIYTSSLFETVPVDIVRGHVQNPDVLHVGDALLFAGNDPDRPRQIGHVEYIYELPWQDYPFWIHEAGVWYYRIGPGQNAHGWRVINGHWYYFDDKGRMLTGLQVIDGERYYLWEERDDFEGACCLTNERGELRVWNL